MCSVIMTICMHILCKLESMQNINQNGTCNKPNETDLLFLSDPIRSRTCWKLEDAGGEQINIRESACARARASILSQRVDIKQTSIPHQTASLNCISRHKLLWKNSLVYFKLNHLQICSLLSNGHDTVCCFHMHHVPSLILQFDNQSLFLQFNDYGKSKTTSSRPLFYHLYWRF